MMQELTGENIPVTDPVTLEQVKENGVVHDSKTEERPVLSEIDIYKEILKISGSTQARSRDLIRIELSHIREALMSGSYEDLDALAKQIDAYRKLVDANSLGDKRLELMFFETLPRVYLLKAQSREELTFKKLTWLDSDNLPNEDDILVLLVEYYIKELELLKKSLPAFHPKGATFLQWAEENDPRQSYLARYVETLPNVNMLINRFALSTSFSKNEPVSKLIVAFENLCGFIASYGVDISKVRTSYTTCRGFAVVRDYCGNIYDPSSGQVPFNESNALFALGVLLYIASRSSYKMNGINPAKFMGYSSLDWAVSNAFSKLSVSPQKMLLWRLAFEAESKNSMSSHLKDETKVKLKKKYEAQVKLAEKDIEDAKRILGDIRAEKFEEVLIEIVQRERPIYLLDSNDDYTQLFLEYVLSVVKGDRAIPMPVRDLSYYKDRTTEMVKLEIIEEVKAWLHSDHGLKATLDDEYERIFKPILEERERVLAEKEAKVKRLEARAEGAQHVSKLIGKKRFEQAVVFMLSGDPKPVPATSQFNQYVEKLFQSNEPLPDNIASAVSAEQKGHSVRGGSTLMMALADPNSPKTRLALASKLLSWFSEGSNTFGILKEFHDLLKLELGQEGEKREAMLSEDEYQAISQFQEGMPSASLSAQDTIQEVSSLLTFTSRK